MPTVRAEALVEALDPAMENVALVSAGQRAEIRLLLDRLAPLSNVPDPAVRRRRWCAVAGRLGRPCVAVRVVGRTRRHP
jgi:hypothetical protein